MSALRLVVLRIHNETPFLLTLDGGGFRAGFQSDLRDLFALCRKIVQIRPSPFFPAVFLSPSLE